MEELKEFDLINYQKKHRNRIFYEYRNFCPQMQFFQFMFENTKCFDRKTCVFWKSFWENNVNIHFVVEIFGIFLNQYKALKIQLDSAAQMEIDLPYNEQRSDIFDGAVMGDLDSTSLVTFEYTSRDIMCLEMLQLQSAQGKIFNIIQVKQEKIVIFHENVVFCTNYRSLNKFAVFKFQ